MLLQKGRGGIRTHDGVSQRICNPLDQNSNTVKPQTVTDDSATGGAPKGALRDNLDADLAQLINAWPILSPVVRGRILGIVEATTISDQGEA